LPSFLSAGIFGGSTAKEKYLFFALSASLRLSLIPEAIKKALEPFPPNNLGETK